MTKSYQVYTLYEIVRKRIIERQRYMNNKKFTNNKQEWYYERLKWELDPKRTHKTEISEKEYFFIKSFILKINNIQINPTMQEMKDMDDNLKTVQIILRKRVSRNPNDDIDLNEKPKEKQNKFNMFDSKRNGTNINRALLNGEQYKSKMIENYTLLSNNKQRFSTAQIERLNRLINQVRYYKHEIISQKDVQHFQNEFHDIMKNRNSTRKNNSVSKLNRLFDKVKKYGSIYFTRKY